MKLFEFENLHNNECSGEFYFVASDKEDAKRVADDMAQSHNDELNRPYGGANSDEPNRNYVIEFGSEPSKVYDLSAARYLPIGRE